MSAARGPEGAQTRLRRLLALVPLAARPGGVEVAEAATLLGVDEDQIRADAALLWVCGSDQYGGGLIDVAWHGSRLQVSNADEIARPLRLGADEATTVIVGLRSLLAIPGLPGRDAAESALAKVRAASGEAASAADRVAVQLGGIPEQLLGDLRGAVQTHHRVHLRYLVPGRDEATERDVDPLRVVHLDGYWYLEGWCHRAEDMRLFRLDRVQAHEVLAIDGTPPPGATPRDLALGAFRAGTDDLVVTVRLEPDAAWVAEQYPVDSSTDLGEGRLRIVLRTPDPEWLERLALRLGGSLVIESPQAVVEGVRTRAVQVLDGLRA